MRGEASPLLSSLSLEDSLLEDNPANPCDSYGEVTSTDSLVSYEVCIIN